MYFRNILFKKSELVDIITISAVLGLLFTFSFFLFNNKGSFVSVFFVFAIFIFILMISRMCFIKYVGAMNGFEVNLRQTYFNQYGFKVYDRMSSLRQRVERKIVRAPFKFLTRVTPALEGREYSTKGTRGEWEGIPMTLIAVFIYVFSLGFIIFPSVWRYDAKTVPYLFIGTIHWKEIEMDWINPMSVTGYRMSRVLFSGFLFYLFFAIIMNFFFTWMIGSMIYWLTFMVIWIAFITLIPIPGTEGYDLFNYSRFAWISSLTVLALGFMGLFVFNSLSYIIVVGALCFFMALFVYFWRMFTK